MEKKKRGRPRKQAIVVEAIAEAAPEAMPARRRTNTLAQATASAPLVRLRIDAIGHDTFLTLVDTKGNPAPLEYRRYSGVVRDALREYAGQIENEARAIRWDAPSTPDKSVITKDNRLLDIAAAAGLLVSAKGSAIRAVPGEWKLLLRINEEADLDLLASLALEDEDGGMVPSAPKNAGHGPDDNRMAGAAPNRILYGNGLYSVADLGPSWREVPSISSRVEPQNLATYLSLTLTRFTGLDIRYKDYAVVRGPVRTAKPALSFGQIDEHGYLYVRPVSSVDGYPPGFFEDFDVTQVVEIDDVERRIIVSEVVFPSDPGQMFRSMITAHDKKGSEDIFDESGRFLLDPDFAESFLSATMPQLLSAFQLYEANKLAHFKIRQASPILHLQISSGIDFLEGTADVDICGQIFSYGRFIMEYRKTGWLRLSDGSKAYPDAREVERLQRLIAHTKDDDGTVGVSFFDVPMLSKQSGLVADGEAWQRAESFFRGYNSIAVDQTAYPVAQSELRAYQLYGTRWLAYLAANRLNGCLADEMGLGKTVQTIALLRKAYADGMKKPSIVVAPKSLVFNWESELRRFAPELPLAIYYGTGRETADFSDARIIITSYATVRIDIDLLHTMEFGFVILDESQIIKNSGTKTTAAVLRLKASHRIALSGTPIENNLGDMYSLFKFLNPGFFGSVAEFRRKYQIPIELVNDEDALRDLKSRIYPFILRRTKRSVLPDLPAKTEQVVFVELEPEHLVAYHRRRLELKERIELAKDEEGVAKSMFMTLQAIMELRRLASVPEADGEYADGLMESRSAKRTYLLETIPEIALSEHKCLVFTNYLASVDLVSQDLAASGIQNLVITGATSDRQSIVRRFQTDPGIRALVMTLKTGGLGLNLTAADYVFILDPWWNATAEAQAIDRTHRIGQSNPVFCYRLIAKGTIEEKMLELQSQKSSLVSSLVTADVDMIKKLDEDDIAYLLG